MPEGTRGRIKETLVVSGLASLLLLIISRPAFKYFFFSEAFSRLRMYELSDRHLWRAAFGSIGGMFFRPGFFFAGIGWDFILPPDPMLYHIRNYVFCVLNLFLFYRVLLKFIQSRPARFIAIGL